MSDLRTLPERPPAAGELEQTRFDRCRQKLEQLEEVLRNEAATLRLAADATGTPEETRRQKMHEVAIRLDALAWALRSFDPDDPTAGHIELPTPSSAPSLPGQAEATNSGEATRTDLGGGPEQTDTGGDISS
ncbi:MAG TPA: hypothetical protein VFA07_12795 [Chthonomonadaceae bacterium]|nr:hypothetical protein [Chthonomonadaceae bacterium]